MKINTILDSPVTTERNLETLYHAWYIEAITLYKCIRNYQRFISLNSVLACYRRGE